MGVALHLPNSADWLAAFLALRWFGAVVIPFDASATHDYAQRSAQHLGCFALQSKSLQTVSDKPRQWKSNVALLKVTSGSSGTPKAIPFTESELCADADNIIATMGLRANDLNFALLPFAHSYALGNLVVPLLTSGIPLAIGSTPLPRVIAEEITESGATVFPSVPSVFDAFTKFEHIDLGKLRLCISAAAPLSSKLAQKFREQYGLYIHNFYGASECGGIAYDRTGIAGVTGESIGQPMENVSLSITQRGLLRVQSAAVSSYGRSIDASGRSRFTLDDKVSFLADGSIVMCGRADRIVKCAGKRIDLAALEHVAVTTPGIDCATALHDVRNDRLLVAIQGQTLADVALANLQTAFPYLQGRIRVKRLLKIPTNARGKIDTATLMKRMLSS